MRKLSDTFHDGLQELTSSISMSSFASEKRSSTDTQPDTRRRFSVGQRAWVFDGRERRTTANDGRRPARLNPRRKDENLTPLQLTIASYLYTRSTEVVVGLCTIINYVFILVDTDINASGDETPLWLMVCNNFFLALYTIEFALRIFVERWLAVFSAWNWLDFLIVTTGLVAEFLTPLGSLIPSVRVLRCFRILRIMKAFSVMTYLKELRKLIRGVTACAKVLLWSSIIVFMFMTSWSTLAVELIHPVMEDVAGETSAWQGCERCHRSFATVMASNLTFFQTIMAGDSWGLVAIPVIEHFPVAAIIFVGALFTLVVGVLNLIIAVLVDAASEARAHDTALRAEEAKKEELAEKRSLEKIFESVDADQNGTLSFDELINGVADIPELQQKLRVMDIQGDDLHELFLMLDSDKSGDVDPEEFIETLYRMKCGDDKAASTFVKHYVMHMKKDQGAIAEKVGEVEVRLDELATALGAKAAEHGSKHENQIPKPDRSRTFSSSGFAEKQEASFELERQCSQGTKGSFDVAALRAQGHLRNTAGTERGSANCDGPPPRSPLPVASVVRAGCDTNRSATNSNIPAESHGHPEPTTPRVAPVTSPVVKIHASINPRPDCIPVPALHKNIQPCLERLCRQMEQVEQDITMELRNRIDAELAACRQTMVDILSDKSKNSGESGAEFAKLLNRVQNNMHSQLTASLGGLAGRCELVGEGSGSTSTRPETRPEENRDVHVMLISNKT